MGTPEFPDLGRHCSVDDCKLIDFLPFTCDCCLQVYCLEHRSYSKHRCPKADSKDVTVVICPLCAKGVHLIPDVDPNICWESHVNIDCDPSNYNKVTKKRRCPVTACRETLTFSNTIKCRDCLLDHCLKHRFGTDHKCPGPKKPDPAFPLSGFFSFNRKEASKPNGPPPTASSSRWTSSLLSAASSFRSSTGAGLAKLSTEFNRALQVVKDGVGQSSSGHGGNAQEEQCLQCGARFSSLASLIEHMEKVHEKGGNRGGVRKATINVCPKCSRGFRDAISLVEHVERDHGGTSRA
ncbi:hypothetical protein MLD38_007567 [Melastoma candidum]|uniref:Uncharacterized protein n=1 Tax=Melastoma candidum TaxID=119954 RepID=A0ACB9RUJ5_9MYRT|nr:hypothetical protein MLD38_007567 [Melastoma candidum]